MSAYRSLVVHLLFLSWAFNETYASSNSKANKKCAEYLKLPENLHKTGHAGISDGSGNSNEEFPHMAGLFYGPKENMTLLCGGTIISENFILTAAHCLHSPNLGEVKMVRVSSTNLKDNNGIFFEVDKIIKHPEFARPLVYNDIALLQLKNSIQFSKSVLPACLNTDFDLDSTTKLIATGWGVEYYSGLLPDVLHAVNLGLYPYKECNLKYHFNITNRRLPNGIDDSTQICAGGDPDGKADTCQGDGGGPLAKKTGALYTVVGIVSFGKGCRIPNVPGVFTRVSAYVPWIEQNLWP